MRKRQAYKRRASELSNALILARYMRLCEHCPIDNAVSYDTAYEIAASYFREELSRQHANTVGVAYVVAPVVITKDLELVCKMYAERAL